MKILNLTDISKSDIKYEISRFPDGQYQLQFKFPEIGLIKGYTNPGFIIPIQIKSRLNNFKDLELIICATKSLRELGVKEIHLYTPYFLGSRSDRKFEEGGNNYLKDVICPIINSLNFKTVTCIDPHSDVLEACIEGFRKESNLGLVKFTIRDLCGFTHGRNPKVDDFILVSPDAGASKKIYNIAEQIGYKGNIITCSKDRDENGRLTKCVVPMSINYWNTKDKIIIDDICDGGQTFINIAKEFKKQAYSESKGNPKIYLIITHGIFSKDFKELSKYFDGIYCTNSYSDIDHEAFNHHLGKDCGVDIVKQINIF